MLSLPQRAKARSKALHQLRSYFDGQDFIEVETPLLVLGPGTEPHIDPLIVDVTLGPNGPVERRYLHTSPELALKRVLAAGLQRVYQVARVFRDGERTARHLPEFTMVEWYRTKQDLPALMRDCERLLLQMSPRPLPSGPWPVRSVRDLFQEFARIDLDTALDTGSGGLLRAAKTAGFVLRPGADDEDAFFQIMGSAVEPGLLTLETPVFVTRWPAAQAAYARLCSDDARYAQRFELYAGGLELANAYDEVTDPVEMERRMNADNAQRVALGKEAVPVDEVFLADLAAVPPTAGIALGMERALMWLWQEEEIDAVTVLPWR